MKPSFRAGQLAVVAVLNNPPRWESRLRLFKEFQARMEAAGVNLVVVEAAYGDREYELEAQRHVKTRQTHELWVKENLINLGVRALPNDWEYLAWIDGDVAFLRPDWAVETIHQLQHYDVVQLFSTAVDLGPQGETLQQFNGFGYSYASNLEEFTAASDFSDYYGRFHHQPAQGLFWHPGYAWAARRQAYEDLGGLLEFAILGAGDHHMALSLIGKGQKAVPKGLHPHYYDAVMAWQERAETHVRRNVGFVPGTLVHHWHGKKADRKYWDRWAILKRWQYDPQRDIQHTSQGVLTLTHRGLRMRHDLRRYFRQRNEDSIDLA